MTDWKVYEQSLAKGCKGRIDWLDGEFNTLRTGRANPVILDGILVESYGNRVPLRQTANVSVPEPRMLRVKPFDKGAVAQVVQAINKANIGLNPVADGDSVKIVIPAPTEESRKAMIKKLKELAEQARAQCRNIRHDVLKTVKADESLSTDMRRDYEERLQKTFKQLTDQIDARSASKEKDIATV